MKGIIFNLLEGFVTQNAGKEKYEKIVSSCSLQTKDPFVGPGTYPDSDFMAIVQAAAKELALPLPAVVRSFGMFAFPVLAKKFPQFVENYSHPKPFLKTIHSVIHVEVNKLYEGASTPIFSWKDTGPSSMILEYQSKRKLCAFAEGLLDGVGKYFNVPIQIKQDKCMLNGEKSCLFNLTFEGKSV